MSLIVYTCITLWGSRGFLAIDCNSLCNSRRSRPVFSEFNQRFFFALNDREREEFNRIKHRVVAIAFQGYFKSKPTLLNPSFTFVQADLPVVSDYILKI